MTAVLCKSTHQQESDVDAAMAIGMDVAWMEIRREIDKLIQECNENSGYGRAQRRVLLKLKERIMQ